MNESPTLPEPTAAGAAAPSAPPTESPAAPPPAVGAPAEGLADMAQRWMPVAVVTLAVLLAAQAWSTHNRVQNLRQEIARSLQKGEAVNNDTSALAHAVQEQTKELQAKVSVLENRQTEAQSQQFALEQLYQDLSKNRDEWALAEIEQVLSTASQQLQLAGNVQGALIALQNADRSLSRSDKPQFITIRRAIAKDTDKLKALPGLDLAGVALHIDNVISQIDALPMLADEKPALPAPPSAPLKAARGKGGVAAPAPAPSGIGARIGQLWSAWSGDMWGEVRQLIRVRSVDTPEALMLAPSQSYFLRENLKLRLLNARLALLSRNEAAFRTDLISAQEALNKYFDTRARATQSVQALLRQVQANNVAIEMPTLSDSLNAVRNYKVKP
jgi:uroporphyrin-3 C-methyltransferase